MARIRTIKPEFFTSATIASLTPLARLFYVSMWCEADREGRLTWNTKTFKLRYFPADDCDMDTIADEVISAGLIVLYEVDGKRLAEIPSFKEHQVINNREAESSLPARVKEACTRVQGEGRKEGKEGKELIAQDKPAAKRGTQVPKDFSPNETSILRAKELGVDWKAELPKFIDHHSNKGTVGKDWDAGFRTWLANSIKFGTAVKTSVTDPQAAWRAAMC